MKKLNVMKYMIIALTALGLTYLSLLIPAQTPVRRPGVMNCEQGCQAAAGFPMPYVVEANISPVGSVSMNPVDILFVHLHEFVLLNFMISYIFWLALVLIVFKLARIQHP